MKYTDFLKNKQFIQWILLNDKSLDKYWGDFIRNNPANMREFQKAVEYLRTKGLNKDLLKEEDRILLLNRIQSTIETTKKKARRYSLVRYVASACAVLILLIAGIIIYQRLPDSSEEGVEQEELIVGNILNNENIQLINGDKTTAFPDNIHVGIDEKGKAIISDNKNKAAETLEFDTGKMSTIIVPYGKRTQLTLSDGTKIWLNSGSILEFPVQFSGNKREIHLKSGEIYLEVAQSNKKPFFLNTKDFSVKVYGTVFCVSTYAHTQHSVVLVEGKIGLQSASNDQEILLSPNEQAIHLTDGTFETKEVDVNPIISWKNGYLLFKQAPIIDVLRQVERYYNVAFDYNQATNLKNQTCTGKIYLSDNLENVMTTISLLSSTKYQTTDSQIFITNEPN